MAPARSGTLDSYFSRAAKASGHEVIDLTAAEDEVSDDNDDDVGEASHEQQRLLKEVVEPKDRETSAESPPDIDDFSSNDAFFEDIYEGIEDDEGYNGGMHSLLPSTLSLKPLTAKIPALANSPAIQSRGHARPVSETTTVRSCTTKGWRDSSQPQCARRASRRAGC